MIIKRRQYQEREREVLAPYAVRSAESRGRKYAEKEDDFRTPFQRDRDRIVHSKAFRRLEYKTQVFVYDEGDHYRTRLTHTLETSQIARSICRSLALNEDLAEAIALGHDLGHGPFGHAGELGLRELMKAHGGFEHNEHTVRVVEKLEDRYRDFPGLNLTFETLAGFHKHGGDRFRTIEADVVDLADEISYMTHDLDDGLRSELVGEEQLRSISLWRSACRAVERRYREITFDQKRRLAVRGIIDRLVKDVIAQTHRLIERSKVRSVDDVQKHRGSIVAFSREVGKQAEQLKRFLYDNLYCHYRVVRMTDKGQRFIKALFEIYTAKPGQLPPEVLGRGKKEGMPRAICDYLAGMTDRFAIDEYKRFFEPDERV